MTNPSLNSAGIIEHFDLLDKKINRYKSDIIKLRIGFFCVLF